MELVIKRYVDGVNDVVLNEESPITLSTYTYSATRMSVPTISGKFYSKNVLEFTGMEYVEFKGEKYFLLNTPTHKKDNTKIVHEYTVSFESERNKLNRVYFYDVTTAGYDKYFTDSTMFSFNGTIQELSDRLNASMSKSGLPYTTVVDQDVPADLFTFSFSDNFLLSAIGQVFEVAEVQFYFDGNTIHFGEPPYTVQEDIVVDMGNGMTETQTIDKVFEYGADNELLSIQKANANFSIINRATGVGSSDNLPYYYPNNDGDGQINYSTYDFGDAVVKYIDFVKLKKQVSLREGLTIAYNIQEIAKGDVLPVDNTFRNNAHSAQVMPYDDDSIERVDSLARIQVKIEGTYVDSAVCATIDYTAEAYSPNVGVEIFSKEIVTSGENRPYLEGSDGVRYDFDTTRPEIADSETSFLFNTTSANYFVFTYFVKFSSTNTGYFDEYDYGDFVERRPNSYPIIVSSNVTSQEYKFDIPSWEADNKQILPLYAGIEVDGEVPVGAYVYIDSIDVIKSASTLMPPLYRSSGGNEVFYNATNGLYERDGVPVEFTNEYSVINPREHKETYDIHPTIEGVANADGQYIDTILDVAYDVDDSDQTVVGVDGDSLEYQHPYFYIKIPATSGEYGFNLFDSAIVKDNMTVSIKTGPCAACECEIQVVEGVLDGKQVFYNPVMVDDNGDILVGNHEDILSSDINKVKDSQHNTFRNSVWLAVKKDTSYITNKIFPSTDNNVLVEPSDRFVLLNISLPEAYIYAAEKRLEDKIIDTLIENNEERFTFSASFSRIYLQNHPDIASQLSENAKIKVKIEGIEYPLYATSYSYKYSSDSLLPEITVQLSDAVGATSNTLAKYAASIEDGVFTRVLATRDSFLGSAIRKDKPDSTNFKLTLNAGLKVTNGITADKGVVYGDVEIGGDIESHGGANFEEAVTVGSGNTGISTGSGTIINSESVEADYLTARRGLKTQSLQINEIQAMSAEYYFSNSAEILSVEQEVITESDVDNAYFNIELDIKEGHVNPFVENDILVGKKNNLLANQQRNNGDTDVQQYYEVWLKVHSVGDTNIVCSMYDSSLFVNEINSQQDVMGNYTVVDYVNGEQVKEYPPVEQTYPPVDNMVLVHRGNADPINHKERTSCWYRSSIEGLDVWLENVTSPILTASNYVCWFGIPKVTPTYNVVKNMYAERAKNDYISSLPDGVQPTYDSLGYIVDEYGARIDFDEGFPWDADSPALFAKTMVYQDDIRIDYEGVISYQENYRGEWSLETAQSETDYYKATATKHDVVYYANAKWEYVSATPADELPPDETDSWRLLEAAVKGDKGDDGTSAKARQYWYILAESTTYADFVTEYREMAIGPLLSETDISTEPNYQSDDYDASHDGEWENTPMSLDNGLSRWASYREYDTTTQSWGAFVTEYLDANWAEAGPKGPAIKFAGEFVTGVDYPYDNDIQTYVRVGSYYYIRKNQNATYPTDLTGTGDSRWNTYWQYNETYNLILATKITAEEIDVNDLWAAIVQAETIIADSVHITNSQNVEVAGVNTEAGADNTNYAFWSGTKANPNFTVDKDGKLTCIDGQFNGILSTTMRRALSATNVYPDSENIIKNSGTTFVNLATFSTGGWGTSAGQIPFDISYAGTVLTVVNSYYTSNGSLVKTTGGYEFNAPAGQYFFENGVRKTKIQMSREVLELLGYGEGDLFYGWIVLNRQDVDPEGEYGEVDKVLFQGLYDDSLARIKYKSYDPDIKLKVTKIRTGEYKVEFVNKTTNIVTSIGTDQYIVHGTCPIPQIDGEYTRIFNYFDVLSTGFRVALYRQTDDRLDGDFNFKVTSIMGWEENY